MRPFAAHRKTPCHILVDFIFLMPEHHNLQFQALDNLSPQLWAFAKKMRKNSTVN